MESGDTGKGSSLQSALSRTADGPEETSKEGGETGRDLSSPLGAQFTSGSPHQCLAQCPAAAGSKDGLGPWLCPPPPTLESYSLGGRKAGAGNATSRGSGEVTRLFLAQILQLWLSGSPSKVFHLLQERWPGAGAPGEPPWSWNNEPFLFSLSNPPLPTPAFEGPWRPQLRTRPSPPGDTQDSLTKWHRAPCRAVVIGPLLLHMEPPVCSCSSD